ncbi:DUF3558 domain-containing protein [Streptomyces kunmingensis]|uniref:DUF3558 domain-containing protein n=1 Tax=Streptomyces kunmingensis TaxID=68225 RepID=A0ABU6CPL0_9ACTN|nr:DUF3558 domain-containing protein [Streptomyces kunmingensis]MEB3966685.1 DUF3558 domain-containing protein [Streptomyces kunmingensis]
MQRKSYACVPGVAVLLTALLAGCSGSSGSDGGAGDAKPGEVSASASTAKPGKYQSLPEPCAQPEQGTLDTMLPGIKELTDVRQREKAYQGTATATYDTDRRAGCKWKDDSAAGGMHRLTLDFERVVSYDAAVSDDSRAQDVFAAKREKAHLPVPAPTDSVTDPATESKGSDGGGKDDPDKKGGDGETGSEAGSEADGGETSSPASPSSSVSPAELQPRLLEGLGDEAFIDDELSGPEASRSRTVTVVFRTSNALVTVQYVAQSTTPGEAPDSKESQDTAQELAQTLVGKFGE